MDDGETAETTNEVSHPDLWSLTQQNRIVRSFFSQTKHNEKCKGGKFLSDINEGTFSQKMLPLERTSPGGYLQWNLVQLNWSSYHPLLERGFLLRDFAPKQFLVQHFFRFFVFFCCFVFLARFDHFTLPSVSDSLLSTHFPPKCHFCTVLHCSAPFRTICNIFCRFAILPFCVRKSHSHPS